MGPVGSAGGAVDFPTGTRLDVAVVDGFYDRYEEAVFSAPAPPGVRWVDNEVQRIEGEVDFLFSEPLSRHIDMAARNIDRGLELGEIAVSVDPRLAVAAIIGACARAWPWPSQTGLRRDRSMSSKP